jgi:hypothetical protein
MTQSTQLALLPSNKYRDNPLNLLTALPKEQILGPRSKPHLRNSKSFTTKKAWSALTSSLCRSKISRSSQSSFTTNGSRSSRNMFHDSRSIGIVFLNISTTAYSPITSRTRHLTIKLIQLEFTESLGAGTDKTSRDEGGSSLRIFPAPPRPKLRTLPARLYRLAGTG